MKILVACEFSGRVRDAFIREGHEALSCDLEPSESPGPHHQGCVLNLINDGWDLMIAFPPCTYLAQSGMHWTHAGKRPWSKTQEALDFVRALMNAPIPRIAIENPIGLISSEIRRADQAIQPYHFGHLHSKKTCLWLKNLPNLKPTKHIKLPAGVRWANQTPAGNCSIGESSTRAKDKSRTYEGIAKAMAEQWGRLDGPTLTSI